MVGLASKITKDFRSQKREDLQDKAVKDIFKSSWFSDIDLEQDLPILEGKEFKKIIKVDGSDLYAMKYATAVSDLLWAISSITYVRNKANVKLNSFGCVRILKKKTSWPVLNFRHTFEYVKQRDENCHVIKLAVGISDDIRNLEENADLSGKRALTIGVGSSRRPLEAYAVLNDDYTTDFVGVRYANNYGTNRQPRIAMPLGIAMPPGNKIDIESFMTWYARL